MVRRSCGRIVGAVLAAARRDSGRSRAVSHLPLGYARVAVLRSDFRKRRLLSFGLGEDLVCTIERKRLTRVQAPDIAGSTIETRGPYRIAWNRAWLAASRPA